MDWGSLLTWLATVLGREANLYWEGREGSLFFERTCGSFSWHCFSSEIVLLSSTSHLLQKKKKNTGSACNFFIFSSWKLTVDNKAFFIFKISSWKMVEHPLSSLQVNVQPLANSIPSNLAPSLCFHIKSFCGHCHSNIIQNVTTIEISISPAFHCGSLMCSALPNCTSCPIV